MEFNKHKINAIYTIFVFIALASLDNAVVGLFPPLFSSIAKDLDIHVSFLGVVSAVNIFITAFSSLFWGYLADKGKRKRLIIIGTIIWSASVFLTAYSKSLAELIIYQFFTGIGLGCISSIGFSVLTDYIPNKWRAMIMSLWGMSQGFGTIAGAIMASIVGTSAGWRRPFEIIALLGLVFTVLYFFIREPKKGATEPELKALVAQGLDYNYSIKLKDLRIILSNKTNLWLIVQGFFMNATTGTLVWLPTLYISKIETIGYSSHTAIITSGYLFALLQIGGLASVYFGYLGDKFHLSSHKGRPLLAAGAIFAAIPLYILMFIVPMKNLSLPDNAGSIIILLSLLKELILNPWMLLMFLLALGATAAQSANYPNWLAIMTDVNLPEHRATAFSIANLVSGAGRAAGNIFIGITLKFVSSFTHEPDNYIWTMSLFQIFFIPALIVYLKVSKTNERDIRKVKTLLKRRGRVN